jgi:hypothetical protein
MYIFQFLILIINMTKPNHFINIRLDEITAKNNIYSEFDYESDIELYKKFNKINIPVIYNHMYNYIKSLDIKIRPITFSPDPAISSSIITSLSEKYMYNEMIDGSVKYLSNLKIIMISPFSHVSDIIDIGIENISKGIISNCICDSKISYTDHKLVLSSSQFYVIGINDYILNDIDKEKLDSIEITYYTMTQLRKKGISKIIKSIVSSIDDNAVHIVFNMGSLNSTKISTVTRFTTELEKFNIGFSINEISEMLELLSTLNIVGLDIVGYNLIDVKTKEDKLICEIAKLPLKILLHIKEKKINIFNQHTKFIIWRPFNKISVDDIGWFIMRGLSNDMKEEFLSKLTLDKITFIEIENDEGQKEKILLSSTTIEEQEYTTYYDDMTRVEDCVVFPEEKISMIFELIN